MKGRKKYIWIAAIVLIAVAAWLLFFRKPHHVSAWKTCNIEKGDLQQVVTATGSLTALTTVEVGTQVSGIISRLFADYNSEVRKGQVIALLDTSLLGASREEAYALVRKAEIQTDEMKTEFARQNRLHDEGVISDADFLVARSNYEAAVSTLKSVEASFRRAVINRQYAVVRAPISGVVISRNVDVGQTVVASFNSPVLFTIANDLRKMQVYANVDEADIAQVHKGQDAAFTVDAFPTDTFTGKVNQIRLSPVVVQNVVTYIVVIDVENPKVKLLPGLTANIFFKVDERRGILKVNTRALQFTPADEVIAKIPMEIETRSLIARPKELREGGEGILWLSYNDSLHPVRVSLGMVEGGYAQVTGQVRQGDVAVVGTGEAANAVAKSPFFPSFRPKRSP